MNEKMTASEKATLGGIVVGGIVVTVFTLAFGLLVVTMIVDLFL